MRGIVSDTIGEVVCLSLLEIITEDKRKENYYKLPLPMRDLMEELGARYPHGGAIKNVVDKYLHSQTGSRPRNMGDIKKMCDVRRWPK